jgi:hypothetical protein
MLLNCQGYYYKFEYEENNLYNRYKYGWLIMLKKILKFLSLGNKSDTQIEHDSFEVLNTDLSKKSNLANLEIWASKYLNYSENINEKKNKVILLSFLLDSKDVYLENMPKVKKQVEDISQYLVSDKVSPGNLINLFSDEPGEIVSHTDVQNYFNDKANQYTQSLNLLLPIFNKNPNNVDSFKEIYKDFSSFGLLGKALVGDKVGAKFLLMAQEDKLTVQDIEVFKNAVSQLKNTILNVIDVNPPFMNYNMYNQIILNENNSDNLKILLEFCNCVEELGKISNATNTSNCSPIRDMLATKIEYLDLKSEVDKTPFSNTTTNKRPKI